MWTEEAQWWWEARMWWWGDGGAGCGVMALQGAVSPMVTVAAEGQAGEPPIQAVMAEAGVERPQHIAQNQTSQDYETFESIDTF